MSLAEQTRWLSVLEEAALVARGEVTSRELVAAAAERLEAAAPLNAVALDLVKRALERADAVAPGASPVAGAPFVLKDLGGEQAGVRATSGARALAGHVAPEDAAVTRAYESAGLVVCARTTTPELGNFTTTEGALFGPTRNPWDLERSTGGSSGGTAALVAAGVVAAGSGGDGTGSIRIPASCCGLVGLKPARARVSLAPEGEGMFGLVAIHALTRTVRDSAALLDVASRPVPGEPYGPVVPAPAGGSLAALDRPPGRLRVALAGPPPWPGERHPEAVAVAERAAAALEAAGHAVEPRTPAVPDPDGICRAIAVLHGAANLAFARDAEVALGRPLEPGDCEAATWGMVQTGRALGPLDVQDAVAALRAAGRAWAASLDGVDAVLCPTLGRPAPPLGTMLEPHAGTEAFFRAEFGWTGWTTMANVTGWAAISVPVGTADGLPLGAQLLAPGDDVPLALAAQLEEALPWSGRRPPAG